MDPDDDVCAVMKSGWREIEVTADSGACETVMPTSQCEDIRIEASEGSRKNKHYEVANGQAIRNVGERRMVMMTEGSSRPKRINFQICDVHKALLSLSKAADSGFETVLGRDGGISQGHRDRRSGAAG